MHQDYFKNGIVHNFFSNCSMNLANYIICSRPKSWSKNHEHELRYALGRSPKILVKSFFRHGGTFFVPGGRPKKFAYQRFFISKKIAAMAKFALKAPTPPLYEPEN